MVPLPTMLGSRIPRLVESVMMASFEKAVEGI